MIPGLPTPLSLCLDAGDADDTFYSQRVYDLFPQMATANSGWATHTASATCIFGSTVATDVNNDSDYIEWTLKVPAGDYKVVAVTVTGSNQGKADLTVDGGAVIDTMDCYTAGSVVNSKWTSAEFTVTEGSHTIRLTKNGKNASSSSYTLQLIHVQLIKQDAGSALVSPSNMPSVYNVSVLFANSNTNWSTVSINTAQAFAARMVSSGAQNAARTFSFWAPAGAFTLALLHRQTSANGIYSVTVDGNSIGTIDGYAAVTANNVLDTTLTGTLTYTGMHTVVLTMATKNASSTNYTGDIQHIQIRMTSITATLTQDLAPEVALLWPLFAQPGGSWTITTSSQDAHYYHYASSGTRDDLLAWVTETGQVLRPGTYRLDALVEFRSGCGKIHCLVDLVDRGNVDTYNAATTYNNIVTISGLTLAGYSAHNIQLKMASKNASASSYTGRIVLARLIRTGA